MLARLREDRVRFHEGASRVKVALRNLLIPIARLPRCQTNASSVEILGGAPRGCRGGCANRLLGFGHFVSAPKARKFLSPGQRPGIGWQNPCGLKGRDSLPETNAAILIPSPDSPGVQHNEPRPFLIAIGPKPNCTGISQVFSKAWIVPPCRQEALMIMCISFLACRVRVRLRRWWRR